jgi:F0F1-type ATP synthase assembly protein I
MQVSGVGGIRLPRGFPPVFRTLPLPDPDRQQDLDALEARLQAARAANAPKVRAMAASAFARGTRYAMEIAVATMVGAGIGWALDRWLGTAAGFRNLMRAVEAETVAARERARAAHAGDTDEQAQAPERK